MKKILLFTGLLTLLFFTSCNEEDKALVRENAGHSEELVVQAVMGDNTVTKTAVQSNNDIYWTRGDAINLFYGNNSSGKFTTSITQPSAVAAFQGTISGVVTGTNESGRGAKSFWGVYPYNSSNTCDGNGVTLTIPSDQGGVAGTFADNLNPTVATAPGLDLAFYNVGSWFGFTVTRTDIASVTFRGNASEDVVGTVRVEMDGNSRPVITQVTNGVKSITVTPEGGGCFTPGQRYFMVLIPQTFSNGYSLTLTRQDGSPATVTYNESWTFTRSVADGKNNLDQGLSFNIEFRDSKVKEICVAKWDTDQDGELSYGEAAAVTSIPYNVFHDNLVNFDIQYFDELQYFTGLTSRTALGYKTERDEGEYSDYGTFENCSKLKSITLPPTLTTISYSCFTGCTQLSEITIPASVTEIQALAFGNNPNLSVYMESETPCTLTKDTHNNYSDPYAFGFLTNRVKAIYVPESAVNAYKNATYWPSGLIKAQYDYVDLGLSVKWATHNVGATSPEEYGDYYAWGETNTKSDYSWSTYKYCNGSSSTLTKYCNNSNYGNEGFTDTKTTLDPADDVAYVKWGGNWRMPTLEEQDELRNNCTWTWYSSGNSEFGGVAGYKVTSNKAGYTDRFIFLPAAGYRYDTNLVGVGAGGNYWSSSLDTDSPYYAWYINFISSYVSAYNYRRYDGLSVRPVCP